MTSSAETSPQCDSFSSSISLQQPQHVSSGHFNFILSDTRLAPANQPLAFSDLRPRASFSHLQNCGPRRRASFSFSHQRHASIRSLSNLSISDRGACQRATTAFIQLQRHATYSSGSGNPTLVPAGAAISYWLHAGNLLATSNSACLSAAAVLRQQRRAESSSSIIIHRQQQQFGSVKLEL
jgi:hypothetical protein